MADNNEQLELNFDNSGVVVDAGEGTSDLTPLDLIKPGKFDIRNFHIAFKDNSKAALEQLLALQSNEAPLKKGGEGIAYRCDSLIINNRVKFNAKEDTLFDIIIGHISSNPDGQVYIIKVKSVQQYFDYEDKSYIYKIFKDATESLSNKPLTFEYEQDGKIRCLKVPWFVTLTYLKKNDLADNDDGTYIAFVPTDFFKLLVLSSTITNGAHYAINVAAKVKGGYSRQLYYFLQSRKNYKEYPNAKPGEFTISLEELCYIVGYPKNSRTTDIKRRILDVGKGTINEVEGIDFNFDYTLIKTASPNAKKKITHVRFKITKLNQSTTKPEPVKLPRPEEASMLPLLQSVGLTDTECGAVIDAYYENDRDLLFLFNAINALNAMQNVRSKKNLLVHFMKNGVEAVPPKIPDSKRKSSPKNQFNEGSEHDVSDSELKELETKLLNRNSEAQD